jgi:hypothetical protein
MTTTKDLGVRCQVSGRKSKRAETLTLKPETLRFGVWDLGFRIANWGRQRRASYDSFDTLRTRSSGQVGHGVKQSSVSRRLLATVLRRHRASLRLYQG